MTNKYFNALYDFKSLSPKHMDIEDGVISIESVLDFSSIKDIFAFCATAETVGYSIHFQKEDITVNEFDDTNEFLNLKIITAFCGRLANSLKEPILKEEP